MSALTVRTTRRASWLTGVDRTCFGAFVNHPDVQPVLAHVCLYCVDATGSEDDAETCTRSPSSVKELVQQLHEVATHFRLDKALVFGIGVGLGGTVLLNYALEYGAHVGGIVLVSADWRPLGWADYAFYTQMHAALGTHFHSHAMPLTI